MHNLECALLATALIVLANKFKWISSNACRGAAPPSISTKKEVNKKEIHLLLKFRDRGRGGPEVQFQDVPAVRPPTRSGLNQIRLSRSIDFINLRRVVKLRHHLFLDRFFATPCGVSSEQFMNKFAQEQCVMISFSTEEMEFSNSQRYKHENPCALFCAA